MSMQNLLTGGGAASFLEQNKVTQNVLDSGSDAHTSAIMNDREWAERQAQIQMNFQKMMSDTAWQRGVKDMQAAGLNPALAYMQGGASSAVGSQASTSSTEQKAALLRERMLFQLTNTAMRGMFDLVGKAL